MKRNNINKLISLRSVCMLLLLSMWSSVVQAGDEKYKSRRVYGHGLNTGALITVVDDKYGSTDKNYVDLKMENYVVFGYDEDLHAISIPGELHLKVKIFTWINGVRTAYIDPATSSDEIDLYVQVNPRTQGGNERIRHIYRLPQSAVSGKMEVEMAGVTAFGGTSISNPDFLFAEAVIEVDRLHDLDQNIFPINYQHSLNTKTGELDVSWEFIPGAEEYHLEWTYINNYGLTSGSYWSKGLMRFKENNFHKNSTRVSVNGNSYSIPMVFGHGYLIYRVRAVGRTMEEGELRTVYGSWSSKPAAGLGDLSTIQDFQDALGGKGVYDINVGHDIRKNWQFSATYAEDGKRKDVIGYFDGSLRNRQSVTKLQSNQTVLVGETMYNSQGNPAINVLPVPSTGQELKYYEKFNQSQAGLPYSRINFDYDGSTACSKDVQAMSTTSGAAAYYGPKATSGDHSDYLPDAQGYPFSYTQYMPDNTGRVSVQSGVGLHHSPGSKHETRYFYSSPDQTDLDRIFGLNVGYAKRYKKNYTIDVNGQPTVAYLDPAGNTIATALVGKTTENLEGLQKLDDITRESLGTLESESIEHKWDTYNRTILKKTATLALDHESNTSGSNIAYETGRYPTIVDGFQYGAPRPSVSDHDQKFTYTFDASGAYTDACITSPGYPFTYDVFLSYKDECATELFNSTPDLPFVAEWVVVNPPTGVTYPSETKKVNGTSINEDYTVSVGIGNYALSKMVRVNEEAVNHYSDKYVEECTTLKTLADFEAEQEANLSVEGCQFTCEKCVTELGPRPATGQTEQADWDALYDQCMEPCRPYTLCDAALGMMLQDVKPGGQYGAVNDYNSDEWRVSVFNPNTGLDVANHLKWYESGMVYNDPDGTLSVVTIEKDGDEYFPEVRDASALTEVEEGMYETSPNNLLNLEDFIDNWKTSWAETFLYMHPEFGYKAVWCDVLAAYKHTSNNLTSDEFDYVILNVEDYNDAASVDLTEFVAFYGNTNISGTLTLQTVQNLVDNDPFFQASNNLGGMNDPQTSPTQTYRAQFLSKLNNYEYIEGAWVNLFDYVAYKYNCGTFFGTGTCASSTPLFTMMQDVNVPDDVKFQLWSEAMALYINTKRFYMDQVMQVKAIAADSYNGCIGNSDFDYRRYGFLDWPIVVISNIYDSEFFAAEQPCNLGSMHYYSNKQARFIVTSEMYDTDRDAEEIMNESEKKVDIGLYLEDGRCPFSYDVEYLLKELAANDALTTNNLSLEGYKQLSYDLYNEWFNLTHEDAYAYPTMQALVGPSFYLTLNFLSNRMPPGQGQIRLTAMSGTTLLDWGSYATAGGWNIDHFEDLYATGEVSKLGNTDYYHFKIKAWIDEDLTTDDNALTSIVLDGKVDVKIANCAEDLGLGTDIVVPVDPSECTPSREGNEVLYWMNHLKNNNQLSSASDVLLPTAYIGEASFLLTTGNGDKLYYRKDNGDYLYEIKDGVNFMAGIRLHPETTEPSIIERFDQLLPVPESNQVRMRLWYMDQGKEVYKYVNYTVTYTGSEEISLGSCPTPCYSVNNFLDALCRQVNTTSESTDGGTDLYDVATSGNTDMREYFQDDEFGIQRIYSHSSGTGAQVDLTIDVKGAPTNTPATACKISFSETDNQVTATEDWESWELSWEDFELTDTELNVSFILKNTYKDRITLEERVIYYRRRKKLCHIDFHCGNCIPEPLEPITCEDAIIRYDDAFTNITDSDTPPPPSPNGAQGASTGQTGGGDHAIDCDQLYYEVVPDYTRYLGHQNTAFPSWAVTYTGSAYFVTLEDFAALQLAHYYEDFLTFIHRIASKGYSIHIPTKPYFIDLISYSEGNFSQVAKDDYIDYIDDPNLVGDPMNIKDFVELHGYDYEYKCLPRGKSEGWELPFRDPCEKYVTNLREFNAQREYNEYIVKVREDFEINYIAAAMKAYGEELKMESSDREYNYTLFYYDQSGSLVRTVPPQGVAKISNATKLSNIQAKRLDPASTTIPDVYPNHTMATTYHYNTLNQLKDQYTPDGGKTTFWYDKLGRLIVSQNAKQKEDGTYSYTDFDELGRIAEVGQLASSTVPTDALLNASNFPDNWSTSRSEVTKTYYDGSTLANPLSGERNYLRNRIAHIIYAENYDHANPDNYEQATHYKYDVHGNVSSLVQDNRFFGSMNSVMETKGERFKRLDYEYDLVSGNVKEVHYQQGKGDQYHHRYEYDDDNRITEVYTSKDGLIYDRDAGYEYYAHGPLARTEIGERTVQGLDYAYTIQGWIKGINSETLRRNRDIGKDGAREELNANSGQDEIGYSLNYFEGDYKSVSTMNQEDQFLSYRSYNPTLSSFGLYNGNIRSMTTGIRSLAPNESDRIQTMAYRYDQLNRITQSWNMSSVIDNDNYFGTAGANNKFHTEYEYDHNGNITKLKRHDDQGVLMDDLSYTYKAGINQLLKVNDAVTSSVQTDDFENEHLYEYDKIGQLTKDEEEGILRIEWTATGKVKKIVRTAASTRPDLEFFYDANGNRTMKLVKNGTSESSWVRTIYVRDATGNVMATYNLSYISLNPGQFALNYRLGDHHLYGSSRLGIHKGLGYEVFTGYQFGVTNATGAFQGLTELNAGTNTYDSQQIGFQRGYKRFELANHLGNVLSVVSDRKLPVTGTQISNDTFDDREIHREDFENGELGDWIAE